MQTDHTWHFVDPIPAIIVKWVFKHKLGLNSERVRFKALLLPAVLIANMLRFWWDFCSYSKVGDITPCFWHRRSQELAYSSSWHINRLLKQLNFDGSPYGGVNWICRTWSEAQSLLALMYLVRLAPKPSYLVLLYSSVLSTSQSPLECQRSQPLLLSLRWQYCHSIIVHRWLVFDG